MNKTIWLCWFQGWEKAPDLCKLVVESWEYHNPDWNIVLLDDTNIGNYAQIDPEIRKHAGPAAYSDVVRLSVLKEHGGVWADATCFCNKSLDEWLPTTMKDAWAFYREDRNIASWFIAAEKDSYIIDYWYGQMVKYWSDRMGGNDKYNGMYMWVHQLFVDACKTDAKFNEIFQSWEKIDVTCGKGLSNPRDRGRGAHYFVPYDKYMNEPLTEESKKRIDDQVDYVYKLNYRQGIDWRSNTTLQYLIKSIDIEINFE